MKLGTRQQDVLDMLRQFGSWRNYLPGWIWKTQSETKLVLDRLVELGHVQVDDGVYTPVDGSD